MSTEHPRPRVGQYVVTMSDLVDFLGIPAGETPVCLTVDSTGQFARVLVQGDDLDELPWNSEPQMIYREPAVRVQQRLDIEDGGPAFTRSAPEGSDEARVMASLTDERLRDLLKAQVNA